LQERKNILRSNEAPERLRDYRNRNEYQRRNQKACRYEDRLSKQEWNDFGARRAQRVQELLQTTLPQFEKELPEAENNPDVLAFAFGETARLWPPAEAAMLHGLQKYTDIRVPALAI
jgi:hypothetical protein